MQEKTETETAARKKEELLVKLAKNKEEIRRKNLAQCIIYFLFSYIFFAVLDQGASYRRNCRRNFKRDSFDLKLEWLVPFLIVESDWRATIFCPQHQFECQHV